MISAISSISLFIFIVFFALLIPNFYLLLGIFPIILLLIITGILLIKFLSPKIPKPKSLIFEKKHPESKVKVLEYGEPIFSKIIDMHLPTVALRENIKSEIFKTIPNFNTQSNKKTLAIQFPEQSDIKEIPVISNQKDCHTKPSGLNPVKYFEKEINPNNSVTSLASIGNSDKEEQDEVNRYYLPHYPQIKVL